MIGGENLAVAPVVVAKDDRGIDRAAIVRIHQVTGIGKPYLDRKGRIMGIEPRQQGRQLGCADMAGDPQRKAAAR